MTQDERWQKRYKEVVGFIESNKRNPSKYVAEERGLLNWMKQQRKLVNARGTGGTEDLAVYGATGVE